LRERRERIEGDHLQLADRLAGLADVAVGGDRHWAFLRIELDVAAAAFNRVAILSDELAGGIELEASVAGIPRAGGGGDLEEALAIDRDIERRARLAERSLAVVAGDAVAGDEGHGGGSSASGGWGRRRIGVRHQLLELEAGGVGVGEIVGGDVE